MLVFHPALLRCRIEHYKINVYYGNDSPNSRIRSSCLYGFGNRGIAPSEMRRRLERVGLVKSLIQDCYDTLHTESREAVANDVVEALKNWERAD